jgi:glyoxylase-like metal-dependent hydrolase (beta-lactamase superfamily II)
MMQLEPLTDWLWCLRTPIVQAYAVRERDGFNLIDTTTAGNDTAILDALAGIDGRAADDVRVYEMLLTHGHDDHTGSAAALAARTGARIVVPRIEAPVVAGEQQPPPPQLAEWELRLFGQVMPNVPHAPPARPDRLVDDGDTLGWEHDARLIAVPGHTPGSIAAWFERDRVLAAGDAVASHEGRPRVGVFNADPTAAIQSFRRLARLDADLACFGHGEPVRTEAGARLAEVASAL